MGSGRLAREATNIAANADAQLDGKEIDPAGRKRRGPGDQRKQQVRQLAKERILERGTGRCNVTAELDSTTITYNAGMSTDPILVHSSLSQDACRKRIAKAAAGNSSETLGYALASQVDVLDGGDRFELRHKLEPVVLTGTVSGSNDGSGSVVRGQIDVPRQNLHRSLIGFVCIISVWGLSNAAWDLFFGTHLLLTRTQTELGPGHPASVQQHLAVFLCVPLIALPIVAMLWPKARGVSNDARQTLKDSLQQMFGN